MKKKDIIKLLRSADEDAAVQLCEEYHGISENDNGRLWHKVQEKLFEQDNGGFHIICDDVTVKNPRFTSIARAVTAAAYILVLGGILVGLLNMNISDTDNRYTDFTDIPLIGADENYYAHNMVSSGALWVDVNKAQFTENGIYQVTLEVESRNAISYSGTGTFFADNFMAAYTSENGIERTVCPCEISDTGELYPYAFTLEDGESCTFTLTYALTAAPDALISGYSEKSLFIKLTED